MFALNSGAISAIHIEMVVFYYGTLWAGYTSAIVVFIGTMQKNFRVGWFLSE
jgi:hypothetical protein